tara:strand:- start:1214 stop:2347 length:1134 start_codon:yes stop_codon:yes gene_type:complete
VNEEEFFRKYMNPDDGIYRSARLMGRMAGERDIVGNYFKRIRNAQGTGKDFYLPENTKEYKPMRDEAFTNIYGKGFVDMYDRYKPIGEGAYGAVFEKPGDSQRVLKVQRQDTLDRQKFGDTEIARQTEAAEMGVAPKIHSVTNFPYKHEVPMEILRSFDNRYGTVDPRHQVTEMDRVNTVDSQGGKIKMLQDYVQKLQGGERGYTTYDKFEEPYQRENAKYNLAMSKAQLHLADRGIVHTDLGQYPYGDAREDHVAYNPNTNKMQFIDYGHTEKYNHAENLHQHTKNLNLRNEELKDYTYGANVEHFLDHKVANIVRGMEATGSKSDAKEFRKIYNDAVDKDLLAANQLVNEGREIIRNKSFKDVVPFLNREELDLM